MPLEDVLKAIDYSDTEIIGLMSGMISIPAISPDLGGEGERKRADYLKMFLGEFDEVKEFAYTSPDHPGKERVSLAAVKKGRLPNTFWIMSHIDTVSAGELSDWDTDPFTLTIKDGRMYGRGTEDDGQAVVASIIAAQKFVRAAPKGMSFGLILVADEEVACEYGLKKIVDSGLFKEGDTFLVPDSGLNGNNYVDIMEKTILWIWGTVRGKTAHGALPSHGINPIPIGLELIDRIHHFSDTYPQTNEMFEETHATFTPTRIEVSPGGINSIPSQMNFAFDCRLIPEVHSADVMEHLNKITAEVMAKHPGATFEYSFRLDHAGKPSSTDTETFRTLGKAIKDVVGKDTLVYGPGGATCASFLREKGFEAYGWVMFQGTEHSPNEFITVDDVKKDAKVMSIMIDRLCYQ